MRGLVKTSLGNHLCFVNVLILSLIAAKYGHYVVTADVNGAYLNADMKDHV
jgi:hypothetical protein